MFYLTITRYEFGDNFPFVMLVSANSDETSSRVYKQVKTNFSFSDRSCNAIHQVFELKSNLEQGVYAKWDVFVDF